ncbi:MAG: hypothetical protein RIG62_06790 [Cyclobacteriaceae bacterium]
MASTRRRRSAVVAAVSAKHNMAEADREGKNTCRSGTDDKLRSGTV